jgi:hypothetical protein
VEVRPGREGLAPVVRIANIDVSNLIAETSAADILELLAVAIDKFPAGSSNLRIYCNRTVKTMLRIQTMNRPNVYLTLGQEEGRPKNCSTASRSSCTTSSSRPNPP